jgi:hypothetical protein
MGGHGETGDPRMSDPAVAYGPDDVAYGPDDPAYGPPGPEWYERAEEARRQEAEEELRQSRGAFEPLPPDHVFTAPEPAGDAGGGLDDDPGDDLDIAKLGTGAVPLEGIKDLYLTAESIGDRRLDKHFDQLLERQRQLISEFFTKSEFRVRAGSGGQDRTDVPESMRTTAPGSMPESERLSFRSAR